MSIGENIRKRREEKNITQAELAKAACVSLQMVSQIEANIRFPSLPVAFRIADKLSCKVDDFRPDDF